AISSPRPPRAHPLRGPEGPSPATSRVVIQAKVPLRPRRKRTLKRHVAWPPPPLSHNVPEVARVLLLALVTSARAPTPSGCPALRFGWHALLVAEGPPSPRTAGGPSAVVSQVLHLPPGGCASPGGRSKEVAEQSRSAADVWAAVFPLA